MTEYMFGNQTGQFSEHRLAELERVASRHGCGLNMITGKHGLCSCGHGCARGECPVKLVWFVGPDRGQHFNGRLARAVEEDLRAHGLLAD